MTELRSFPPVPAEGSVTVREQNGEMISVDKCAAQDAGLPLYPEFEFSHDLLKPSVSKETAKSAFLEHNETQGRRLWHAWYEHGVTGVLEELANTTQTKDRVWLCKVACTVLGAVRWANSLHGTVFPHYSMSNDEITSEFSRNPSWKDGYIRCFAWHPQTNKYAVSLRDDSIKIHQANRPDFVPILKHKLQKGVADLAWRPNSASLLAVACHSCILVWNIEPTSLATRPSTSAANVLTYSGHSPVTSVVWEPSGNILLSASATCTAMLVWDGVSKAPCVPLRRWGGGGMSLLSYSPDGSKVLAACPSHMFRLWQTQTWSCETWSKLSSRVQCACWSPDGSVLLFACSEEAVIHSVVFKLSSEDVRKADICSTSQAVPCANLSPTEVEMEGGDTICVGGLIQNMVWDSTGERLAVQFTGVGAELIAVYQTRLKPMIELIPCGFVRGRPGERPDIITFRPTFTEGALLTVVWSSGRVSHMPMYFVSRSSLENNGGLNSTLNCTNTASMNRSLYTA